MSILAKLKAATSLHDLAQLLGYSPQALAFLLYKLPSTSKYTEFSIKKKKGGSRQIKAPVPKLKRLQRHLANLLQACRAEIEASAPQRKSLSHGFRKSHSIVTNARPHTNRRFVLNLDLENFFPTFNFGRVRGFFIKNNDYKLHKDVATIIAQIACHENELPQGAPSSPIISDIIAHILDVRLAQLAKAAGCTYSRYADDLTFSTNRKAFPPTVAFQSPIVASQWILGSTLVQQIQSVGFLPNLSKTRMHLRASRQSVTGLVVNKKVNVSAKYYRRSRSMCRAVFNVGEYHCGDGVLSSSMKRLDGILGHVYFVKRESVLASKQLGDPKDDRRDRGVRKLYRSFLFFRHFVRLDRPLVLCEGETDNLHLSFALKKLAAGYPSLAGQAPYRRKVAFFNHTRVAKEVLKLGGGTGGIQLLLKDYAKMVENYKFRPFAHPVIVLVDNDEGSNAVFSVVKEVFKPTTITKTSTAPFYHLVHNLYLVKTPEIGAAGTSCIEDMYEKKVQRRLLGGKKFSRKKNLDVEKEYGKKVFAKKVIRQNLNTTKFDNFKPLLDRISAVIAHYKPPA